MEKLYEHLAFKINGSAIRVLLKYYFYLFKKNLSAQKVLKIKKHFSRSFRNFLI